MPTYTFPSRAFRRNRERSSGLLFAFGVDDLSTAAVSGQTLTFTRATGRTVLDSLGRVVTLAHSQVPWAAQYNTAEGVYEPVYDAQSTATNLCLQSENFGTTWSANGTPTRTAAALKCGDLALDLLGDDDAAGLEGYGQVIAGLSGNAVKAVSFFVAQGSATSSSFRWRDTTAVANRLLGNITWSSGVPQIAMTTGTYIGQIACANNVYRLLFQTTSATAANANQVEIWPSAVSLSVGPTGTLYCGGFQVENKVNPSSYIKTTTASVTANVDQLTTSVTIPLADFTVYVRVARPNWSGLTTGWATSMPIVSQPTTSNNGRWYLEYDPANGRVNAGIMQAGSGSVAFQSVPATAFFDVCAQWTGFPTAPKCRVDVGSGFSSYSSTVAAISNWDSNSLLIGSEGSGSIDAGIRKILIASGARTLAQMRGVNV